MFFKKKELNNEDIIMDFTQEIRSCEECRCLIKKYDAQKIEGGGYFCQAHRRPYSRIGYKLGEYGTQFTYHREFEVDKDGKLLTNKNK